MFVRGQPDLCKQMRRQKVKSKSDLVETRTCGEESSNSSSTHSTISQVSRNSTVQRSNLGMLLLPREYSEITPHHRNSPPMDQRNTHPHGFPTNEINERVTGRGDWLDRLEAMYTPTDLQLSSAGKFSGGDSRGSGGDSRGNQYWLNLEPTPIRTDLLGDKKPKALPQKNDLKVFQPPHS